MLKGAYDGVLSLSLSYPAPVIQKGVNGNSFYEILINCYCAFTTA